MNKMIHGVFGWIEYLSPIKLFDYVDTDSTCYRSGVDGGGNDPLFCLADHPFHPANFL